MANIKEIEALTNAFGPSGFEDEVIREVKNWCGGLDVVNDAMYNVYATMKKKKAGRPVLMLDAHLDECGFMVQSILENGLLSILMLGGFHLTSLPAHSVIVRTRDGKKHRGITTSKPMHFLTAAQKNDNSLAIEDILVDVGASSREEVMEVYGIRPGDPIMPDVSFEYHEENRILYGKAFDNRLGCVSIIDTMQALKDEADQLEVEVVGAFAAQEEVGTRSFPKLKIPHQSHADFCSTDTAGGLDNKKRRYAPRGGVAYRLFLWGFPKGATPPFGTRLCEAKCSVLYALSALP